jgi:hypothetical protein
MIWRIEARISSIDGSCSDLSAMFAEAVLIQWITIKPKFYTTGMACQSPNQPAPARNPQKSLIKT